MKSRMFAASLIVAVSGFAMLCSASQGAETEGRMLAHDVYFSLKEDTAEAKETLVAACKKYLSDHPGIVWFAAGPLASEFDREVNDRDFDVALHIVFKSKASHDTYQTSEKHEKFIAECEKTWAKVRVFDSYVSASSHGDVDMQGAKKADKAVKAVKEEKGPHKSVDAPSATNP